jgi:hypothetical protein
MDDEFSSIRQGVDAAFSEISLLHQSLPLSWHGRARAILWLELFAFLSYGFKRRLRVLSEESF